jgi:hypothetical protein
MMGRVALNMGDIGKGYKDLLSVMYGDKYRAKSMQDEISKVSLIG